MKAKYLPFIVVAIIFFAFNSWVVRRERDYFTKLEIQRSISGVVIDKFVDRANHGVLYALVENDGYQENVFIDRDAFQCIEIGDSLIKEQDNCMIMTSRNGIVVCQWSVCPD